MKIKKQFIIAGLTFMLSLTFGSVTASAAETMFADEGATSSWEWARDSIRWAYERGIVAGKTGEEGNIFDADGEITRAEAAAMLVRWQEIAMDEYDDSCETFADVEPGEWYTRFVNAAYENGLIAGKADESFEPDSYLTRAEAAALIVTAKGWELETTDAGFTDVPEAWHTPYINTAHAHEIIAGKGNNIFAPRDAVTRAEFVVMLNATRYDNAVEFSILWDMKDFVITDAKGRKVTYIWDDVDFAGDVVDQRYTTMGLYVCMEESESFTIEPKEDYCRISLLESDMYIFVCGTNIDSIVIREDGIVELTGENMEYHVNVKVYANLAGEVDVSDTASGTVIYNGNL